MFGDATSNFLEYSVVEKPNKKTKTRKAVIIASAVAVFVVLFGVLSAFASAMVVVMPMATVLIVFAAFIFWKYTKIEYDYVISGGDMQMHIVYGGRNRKELFTFKISSAELIADLAGNPTDNSRYQKVYTCVSSMEAENILYVVFKNGDGEKCIAYFEAPKKAFSLLKFYNSSAYRVSL